MRHFLQKVIPQIGQKTTFYLILMKPSQSSVGHSFSYESLARLAKTKALQYLSCWFMPRDLMWGEFTQRTERQSSLRQRTNLNDYRQLRTCWDRQSLQNICLHGPNGFSQEGLIQTEQTGHPSIPLYLCSLLAFRRYFLSFHLWTSCLVTSRPPCPSSFAFQFIVGNLRLRQRTLLFAGESLSSGMASCPTGRELGMSKSQLEWLFGVLSMDGL